MEIDICSKALTRGNPGFWEQVAWFANLRLSSQSLEEGTVSSQDAQLCVENLLELDAEVFDSNKTLLSELCERSTEAKNNPLGCVLIVKNTKYRVCGAALLSKKRESVGKVVVYDDQRGTYV